MVRQAHDDRPRAQRGGVARVAERGDETPDVAIDETLQVRVEADVVAPRRVVAQRPQQQRQAEAHQAMRGRLRAQVLAHRRRQPDLQVGPVGRAVAAPVVGGGIGEHVVGVDERDDQGERLAEVLAGEVGLGLGGEHVVPARAAAAEVLGLDVLAGVGRLPLGEAVVGRQALGVGRAPCSAQRAGEVPLALVGDLVAARAQQRGEVGQGGIELGLGAVAGADPGEHPEEVGQPAHRRDPFAAGRGGEDRGHVAEVRLGATGGQGQRAAVLGGHEAGQEGCPARRAHARVARRLREAQAGPAQLRVGRHQRVDPARLVGPVARGALLVGDHHQDVGRPRHAATLPHFAQPVGC